jgi:hypothetical protein
VTVSASPLSADRGAPWHCSLQAPPALPLLLLSPYDLFSEERLYCPEDDDILRIPLPSSLRNMKINGSNDGGWVTATPSHSPDPIVIVNLFSGAEVKLSEKQSRISCPRHPGRPYIIWN